jgi:signal transduction histidine kinase
LCHAAIQEIKTGLLQNRKLVISEDYAAHVPAMPVDSTVMRIILINLIANAVMFTPDTGNVYVRLRYIEEKLHQESQGSLQIEIQDNGQGIPHMEQKKLFTKFFRASNNRALAQGSGLGLYIAKMTVEYVGGIIAFQSQENAGSIFIITFPIEGMPARNTAGQA